MKLVWVLIGFVVFGTLAEAYKDNEIRSVDEIKEILDRNSKDRGKNTGESHSKGHKNHPGQKGSNKSKKGPNSDRLESKEAIIYSILDALDDNHMKKGSKENKTADVQVQVNSSEISTFQEEIKPEIITSSHPSFTEYKVPIETEASSEIYKDDDSSPYYESSALFSSYDSLNGEDYHSMTNLDDEISSEDPEYVNLESLESAYSEFPSIENDELNAFESLEYESSSESLKSRKLNKKNKKGSSSVDENRHENSKDRVKHDKLQKNHTAHHNHHHHEPSHKKSRKHTKITKEVESKESTILIVLDVSDDDHHNEKKDKHNSKHRQNHENKDKGKQTDRIKKVKFSNDTQNSTFQEEIKPNVITSSKPSYTEYRVPNVDDTEDADKISDDDPLLSTEYLYSSDPDSTIPSYSDESPYLKSSRLFSTYNTLIGEDMYSTESSKLPNSKHSHSSKGHSLKNLKKSSTSEAALEMPSASKRRRRQKNNEKQNGLNNNRKKNKKLSKKKGSEKTRNQDENALPEKAI